MNFNKAYNRLNILSEYIEAMDTNEIINTDERKELNTTMNKLNKFINKCEDLEKDYSKLEKKYDKLKDKYEELKSESKKNNPIESDEDLEDDNSLYY